MHVSILHNADADLLEDDPGRLAREDVKRVAAEVASALEDQSFDVSLIPVAESFEFLDALRANRPDMVLNLCESLVADSRGEMLVPCLLELFNIPYTGSSALSLGLALHKSTAKELLRAQGVPTPEYAVVNTRAQARQLSLPFPLIVKPVREDASVGVDADSVVHDPESLERICGNLIRTFQQPALVERYIDGREIYVPLLGNNPRRSLPLTEIRFGKAFENQPKVLSYRAKWESHSPECIDSPSELCTLPPAIEARCVEVALAAFEALDCRDYGRVDMRLSAEGEPYVIDINPNCDLHPDAGFARAALNAGMSYPELTRRLVEVALERTHGNTPHRRVGSRGARRTAQPDRNVLRARGRLRARAH
ncbi:MAG: ATP-grasp domain-containing protein [Myxococcaceae bacterium]